MKPNRSFGLAVLMVAVLALAVPQLAQAAGTDFGTTVTNSATIQYLAGSSPITTNTSVDFLVDRVLDWTIAPSTAGTVAVFPASTGNSIAYSVQNATNGTVDILFTLNDLADAPSTVALYADDGGSPGVFDTGDTILPNVAGDYYLDEVGEDTAPTVFIVVDVAAAATSTDVYSYEIASVTYEGNSAGLGAILSDDSASADISTQVQNVYNDGAGYSDVALDQNYTAYAAFQAVTVSLTATKTAVVSDIRPFNNTNPKAIPLANVHYTITITNTGTAEATGVSVTDGIPANTILVGGSLSVTGGGGGVTPTEGDPITVTGAVITGGSSMVVEFDVTIQ